MLKYTGHPIIDVGAAAMAAFVDKDEIVCLCMEISVDFYLTDIS